MIHAGNAITVQMLSDGIAEFRFDLQGESVNKFNRATIEDFKAAIDAVKANGDIKGLIVTSAKSTFIVGADITEFGANFAQGEQAIVDWALPVHDIFNAFEDLEIPKVAAINGMALGGGFEMCLVCDYRVMSEAAQVGLPENKLGIFPGFGGTVRLSRLIGIDNAVEWMAMANPKKPAAALKDGAVDAVVAADKLTGYDAAIATGSNSTATHFRYYFSHVPHIIRQNRNSIAVLSGHETDQQLLALGQDIFSYFGLGCRNVSKIFVPEGYNLDRLFEVLEAYKEIIHHHKYKNNYDYNVALFLLNKENFLHNDMLIFKASEQIISRIGSVHYQYYEDIDTLSDWIHRHESEIQCVVTSMDIPGVERVDFGQAQCPSIDTYADGVDTMQFLLGL